MAKPNPLTLVIGINKADNKVTLNNEEFGDTTDTSALTTKLQQVFKDRENNGVLKDGTNEVEKTVFIKSPRSLKYGNVVKVIDAAKIAGAQPIGLQIDDLSE